jgi:hypothetical protein
MISRVKISENSKFSDHNLITTFLTEGMEKVREGLAKNLYAPSVPLHDLRDARKEDWFRYEMIVSQEDWENTTAGMDLDEMVKLLYHYIELTVDAVFPLRKVKQKGNHNPKEMRKLMTKKRQISSRIRCTRSVPKLVPWRKDLE